KNILEEEEKVDLDYEQGKDEKEMEEFNYQCSEHIKTILETKSLNPNQKKILGDISRKLNLINNNIHINTQLRELTAFQENKDKTEESKEELTKKSSHATKQKKSKIQTKKVDEDGIDREFLNQLINANNDETAIS